MTNQANHTVRVQYTNGEIFAYYRKTLGEAVTLANQEVSWIGTESVAVFGPDQSKLFKIENIARIAQ